MGRGDMKFIRKCGRGSMRPRSHKTAPHVTANLNNGLAQATVKGALPFQCDKVPPTSLEVGGTFGFQRKPQYPHFGGATAKRGTFRSPKGKALPPPFSCLWGNLKRGNGFIQKMKHCFQQLYFK